MRLLFTTRQAREQGITPAELLWGEEKGRWRRILVGVYGVGPEEPTDFEVRLARVVAQGGIARGHLAAVIHGLDSVTIDARPLRRRQLEPERVVTVGGIRCADGLQTLIDIASTLSDDVWEQALESALRKKLTTIAQLVETLPRSKRTRADGILRIRRILRRRPEGAAPTGSLLETLMIQLARTIPGLPPPVRQFEIRDQNGRIIAYLDLAWPELGLFIELDGQRHLGQPVYDASRETFVVSLTGWLCGRFTWKEVVRHPRSTARRLEALVAQARQRPVPTR